MVNSILLGLMVILGGGCLLSWLMGVEFMLLIFLMMVGYMGGMEVEGGYVYFIVLVVGVVMVSVVLSMYVQGLRVSLGCQMVV